MASSSQVFVVIPALNEAATIRALVEGIIAQKILVILVDDGSDDGTGEEVSDLPITLLRHESRKGKAAALLNGMHHALERGATAVISMDGDGQHRAEDLPAFLHHFAGYPDTILIGSRDLGVKAIPPLRLFANRFANFWISWASGYPIKDSQCGFRLYPRPVLELLRHGYEESGSFVLESEILIDAARAGYRSIPVSIPALYAGVTRRRSHFRPVRDIWQITRMVARKLLSRGLYLSGLAAMTAEWWHNGRNRENPAPALSRPLREKESREP